MALAHVPVAATVTQQVRAHVCVCVCDHIKHVGAQEADMGEGGSLGVQKLECVRV